MNDNLNSQGNIPQEQHLVFDSKNINQNIILEDLNKLDRETPKHKKRTPKHNRQKTKDKILDPSTPKEEAISHQENDNNNINPRTLTKRLTPHFGQEENEKIRGTVDKILQKSDTIKTKKSDKSPKEKSKKDKKTKKEQDIEKNKPLAETSSETKKIKGRHKRVHLAEEMNETILSLIKDKKDADNYKEDIMNGLNIISYLNNKRVPIANKILYCVILLTMIASYAMNIWDLILYASNTCEDSHSPIAMYINFFSLIFIKIGIFNYVTAEINSKLEYDLKFPFLIPILTVGVAANFQLPLVVYNYNTCSLRSPFFEIIFGYFVIEIIAGVIVTLFAISVLTLILSPKINLSHNKIKMIKTIIYFLSICTMLLMNILFISISLSQANHFSLTLLTENILYWTLFIAGAIVFVLRKKYKKEMFLSFDDYLERQNTGDPAQELEEIIVKKDEEKPHKHYKSSKIVPIFKNLELVGNNTFDNSSKPFGLRDEKDSLTDHSFTKSGTDRLDHTPPSSSKGR